VAGDENDWHFATALCQLPLQIQPAQARQLYVEHETRCAFRWLASQEIPRGRKWLDLKSCRFDQPFSRAAEGSIVVHEIDERLWLGHSLG
jgi:hypothetical protein